MWLRKTDENHTSWATSLEHRLLCQQWAAIRTCRRGKRVVPKYNLLDRKPDCGQRLYNNFGRLSSNLDKIILPPSTLIWTNPTFGNLSITFKSLNDRGTFRFTYSNSCASFSKVYEFKPVSCGAFIAYPNPATDVLTLEFENTERLETLPGKIKLISEKTQEVVRLVDVVDIFSKKLFSSGNKVELRVADLPRGTYYIHSIPQDNSGQEKKSFRIMLE